MKYILVSGGCLSGLGKGICASSTGLLLQMHGLHVTAIKIDPYLNIDAGTMSPFEHGEVYVLRDGGETDLDLGNYERFLDITLTKDHNITTGKIYKHVIDAERRGDYLGKTVQIVPHVTTAIKEWIERVAGLNAIIGSNGNVCIIELGGTIGDFESGPFVEGLRQLKRSLPQGDFCHVHVTLVPTLGEQKTKPTQQSVGLVRRAGLPPDFIITRSDAPLGRAARNKIAAYCDVAPECIISSHNTILYNVPIVFHGQGYDHELLRFLKVANAPLTALYYERWYHIAETAGALERSDKTKTLAIVGKYTQNRDSYLSLLKAIEHAAIAAGVALDIRWVSAEGLPNDLNSDSGGELFNDLNGNKNTSLEARLEGCDYMIVPGGFGSRGFEGKVRAVQWAYEHGVKVLGICLGMQVLVTWAMRALCGIQEANSIEVDPDCKVPSTIHMHDLDQSQMGGTMRLGLQKVVLDGGSMVERVYGGLEVLERYRHRYEIHPAAVRAIEEVGCGVAFTGRNRHRMAVVEGSLKGFEFIGVQYHPEYETHAYRPHPLFRWLIK